MNRTILILLITLSCALPLFAQGKNNAKDSRCTLPIERAPELRGLRVGTSQASVVSRFPGISVGKPDQFGIAQLRLTIVDTDAANSKASSRDKGVQADMTSPPGGESAFIVDSSRFPILKGTRRVRVRFFNGQVAYVEVAYDDSIKWSGIDEFIETVAKTLNLPESWTVPADADSGNTKELRCEGFVLTGEVGADSNDARIAAQLSVEDLAVTKMVEKKQNDLKEKAQRDEDAKRKNFKP